MPLMMARPTLQALPVRNARRSAVFRQGMAEQKRLSEKLNSLAGEHQFKSRVDAENEFGHFLYAGIVGAGVEDAQVNGGMLLVVARDTV